MELKESTKVLLSTPTIRNIGGWVTLVSKITEDSVDSILEYLDEEDLVVRGAEKYYREVEYPKVQKQIEEFVAEFPEEWRKERLLEHLQANLEDRYKAFRSEWHSDEIKRIGKEILSLIMRIRFMTEDVKGTSPEMILQARQYPMEKIIENQRNFALCPFHSDKKPSLYIKNNFYYCFSCAASGDTIDLYKKLHSVDFKTAVSALNTM